MLRKIVGLLALVLITAIAVHHLFFTNKKQTQSLSQPKLGPGEWMAAQRMYPFDAIKPEVYQAEMQQAHQMHQHSTRSEAYVWEFVGPTNIGGRITDIEIPAGQSDIIYVGAATGGVLKTDNAGQTWEQLFHEVPTISVGDIAIDPQQPEVLYVGTGEANSSSFSFLGSGVYKSTNGGESWTFSGLEHSAYIGRMIVDHSNSDRVFAAACGTLFSPSQERGIYRSTDAGDTWEQVLFVSDTTAAIDLVQHPTNPDILYAGFWERTRGLTARHSFGATTGIYKTTDGGDTWQELTNGLPTTSIDMGRVGLTISQSNPKVLYALFDMPEQETWVFKTENGGELWERVNDNALYGMNSYFGWYFGQIRVHPQDENLVFALGQAIYRSGNAGNAWSDIGNSDVHVDHHAMCFDVNSGKTYLGNDGGLYYSTNNGDEWIKINNLPITQFYAYDVSETNQNFQVGGAQDNNSIRTIVGAPDTWEAILGGDGMYNRINQQNNDVAWAEYQFGNLFRSYDAQDTWANYEYVAWQMEDDRKNWSAPLELTPNHNEIAYFGTHRVWKTIDNGDSWDPISGDLTQGGDNYFHTLTCLAVSELHTDYVLAGSGDGKVHISLNGGSSWEDISEGLPNRWVTDVYFDPIDENTIYATVSGFRWDEALPHIFKSEDLGQSWQSISGNLPQLPVNVMVIDPNDNTEIIVGTDAGIYMTVDGGAHWESISANMPMVPVVAFKLIPATKDLYAATYGLSTWKMNLDDINLGIDNVTKTDANFQIQWIQSTTDYIEITNHTAQSLQINVVNAAGQLISTQDLGRRDKGVFRIALANLIKQRNGVYMIQVCGKDQAQSIKVKRL